MFTDYEKEREFLESYIMEHPDSLLFARLADAFLQLKQVDRAVEVCEEGMKRHPYYATGHFILGKCYMAKKEYESAEKEFKRVLLFDPKYLSAHKHYGDLMKEIGWENTCETSYRKILQIDPLDQMAREKAGEHIIEGGEELPEETTAEQPASPVDPTPEKRPTVEEFGPPVVNVEEEDLLFSSSAEEKLRQEEPLEEEVEKPAPELDDEKAEQFSYILDDIFKDEVVDDEESTQHSSRPMEKEDDFSETEPQEPEGYLSNLSFEQPQEGSQSKKREQPSERNGGDVQVQQESSFAHERSPIGQPLAQRKTSGQKIVTPTLGEIYAAQGQYSKAIDVFETLLKKHPDNEFYLRKIAALKQKLEDSKG